MYQNCNDYDGQGWKKEEFLTFKKWFEEANRELGKKQYLVPYFMSSHPGCTLETP